MKKNSLRLICLTGIFTATVYVFTAYLHIPSHTGYTHIGDGFIYLSACLLPVPYAMFAGAAGAMLADCLTGFAVWAPASMLIKALTVLFFKKSEKKILTARNIAALIPSALLCSGGYYLYESLITGNFYSPLAGIPGYITQSVLSSVLFVAAAAALDRLKLSEKITK